MYIFIITSWEKTIKVGKKKKPYDIIIVNIMQYNFLR